MLAIIGKKVNTITDGIIKNGVILVEDGKIKEIGPDARGARALKAITIIPAEILGVADRVGSLEVGKDADLRLLSGEPLEYMTKCQKVIIDGEVVYSLK